MAAELSCDLVSREHGARPERPADSVAHVLPRPRRTTYVIAAVLLAGVVVAGVAVSVITRNTTEEQSRLTPDAEKAVTVKARGAIEAGASPYLGPGLACGVRFLGADPLAATRADQVATAYVWVVCGTISGPTESSVPVAVHFTDPPTAEVPGDGSLNMPDKKKIFPVRLWRVVIAGPSDTDPLSAEMSRRRQELSRRG